MSATNYEDHAAWCGNSNPHEPHETFGSFGCPGVPQPEQERPEPVLVDETGDRLGRVTETRLEWSGNGEAEYTVIVRTNE